MTVELDNLTLPHTAKLEVNIHLSADIQVTASIAKRRVSRLVISEIGNLLYGDSPSLLVGDRLCWRVPVMLAYPDTGPIGQVGTLDVDVETGSVLATTQLLTEMKNYALYLTQYQ